MSVDNEATRLMLKLEQGLHKKGWDRPPGLYSVRRRAGSMSLEEHPVKWGNNNPGAVIENIAWQMSAPTVWGEMVTLAMAMQSGFHGILFSHEAWQSELPPSERQGRRLADIPGSKEMRGVFALLTTGHAYYVSRIRGEKPEVDEFEKLGGRIPAANLQMVKTVAPLLPDREVDREALDRLNVVDDEEFNRLAYHEAGE